MSTVERRVPLPVAVARSDIQMFPQAELENYKLQVELLQEKLRHSEDHRQQLEHKLDKVLQKRSELEKSVRHKTRQQYKEFLEEQSKRNERNKKLVQMLERIDEQTAAMAQRSERLKMMKLQYQMYFAKLVQSQTLRCLQQTTAPGGGAMSVPVLIQPQPSAVSHQAASATVAAAAGGSEGGSVPAPAFNSTQSQPLLIPLTTGLGQQWAFATATQSGMLLTPQVTPQPVFVPYTNVCGAGGAGGGGLAAGSPLATSNLFDLRATLHALDSENADLPERMTHFDAAALAAGESQNDSFDRAAPAKTTAATEATPCSPKDTSAGRELSSTSSTLATSSLTFDKLPMTATRTETPTAAGAVTSINDVVGGRPQEAPRMRRGSQAGLELNAWPSSRVAKGDHEKSPSVASYNEANWHRQEYAHPPPPPRPQQQQYRQQQHNIDAYFGELKIDEPWQTALPAGARTTTRPREQQLEDKMDLSVRAGEMKTAGGDGAIGDLVGGLGISDDLLDEVNASRAALEVAAAAVDEQLARGNQLSSQAANEPFPKPGVSIENIENAIYGERLTTAATAMSARAAAVAAAAAAAAATTSGLIEAQSASQQPRSPPQQEEPPQQQRQTEVPKYDGEQVSAADPQQLPEHQRASHDAAQIGFGQYDANGYIDHGEPSYASIEAAQQQQPQQQQQSAEPIYSEIGNPTDYERYAADANAAGEAGSEAAAAAAAAQQEYSEMDYSNYEAAQYAAGYDPNAYPGYIYDEATGQYIADPNSAQYAPDGGYAGQEYDAAATNYEYYAEQQQQQQEQQQQQQEEQQPAGYPTGNNNNAAPEVEQVPPSEDASEATHPPPATGASSKPTSILASTDKQATSNDAHQQQQQQQKKKKRVNFVDSSETDDSSSAKPAQELAGTAASPGGAAPVGAGAGPLPLPGSESDFDFSTGSEAKN